jgi:hypothetical protein
MGASKISAFGLINSNIYIVVIYGRAVAQAVSPWFTTAAASIRVRAACGGLWWTK